MHKARLICLCLLMTGAARCRANEQPFPAAEAVAEAFRFPISKLRVTNASQEASRKHEGRSVEAWVFTSPEHVFAPVNSVLADGGSILTEKIKTEFETILASARPDRKVPVLRAQIGEATGYAGVAGFGPGGAALAVTLYLPAQNQDLQIIVNIPLMDRTDVAEDLSDYVRLFSGGGGDMLQSLLQASSNAVQIVSARAAMPGPEGPGRSRLPVAPTLSPTATSIPAQPIHARGPDDLPKSETDNPRRFTWMHFTGALVMGLVLLWYFRRSLGGPKQ